MERGKGATLQMQQLVDDLANASKRDVLFARKDGDIDVAAKTRVDAVYQQPFLAHGDDGAGQARCTCVCVWVGTQVPTRAVDTAAKVTGLPADNIVIHNPTVALAAGWRR